MHVPQSPKMWQAVVAICAHTEVWRGFHVREEPPIMTTEMWGECPLSVLYGGVPD